MNKNRFFAAAAFFIVAFSGVGRAQTDASGARAPMEIPRWVNMMDDPEVNYFEAIQAYDEFWKNTSRPTEEEDVIDNTTSQKGKSKRQIRRERNEREREYDRKKKLSGSELERAEYLKYQSKRFENWAREVKPWVQENGHILNEAERTAIWKQQQEELKQQENKK
jgi:hypothetical protein